MRFHFRILFLFAFWDEYIDVADVLFQAVFRRLCRFCQPFSARRCPAEISVADVLFQAVFRRLCRFCQPFSARRCPAEISVADVLFQVVVRRLLFLSRE